MKSGDIIRTRWRIPGYPHSIPADTGLVALEVRKMKKTRARDKFGNWETFGGGYRVRVEYKGTEMWIDGEAIQT